MKSQICTQECNSCDNTDCDMDFRSTCFGVNCASCKLECRLKTIGTRKAHEQSGEIYAQTHATVLNTVHLVEELDVPDTAFTDGRKLSPAEQVKLDTIRKMAFFYLEHPAEFDKYILQFFCGKTQADVARDRGVTRQNISKIIKTERSERLKREIEKLKTRNAAFCAMTPTELKIYQLCAEDGVLNVSSVAKQAKVSRVTVYKTLHNLRSKYGFCFTLSRCRAQKK